MTKGLRPVTATDNCHRDIARDLLADLRRLDRQVKDGRLPNVLYRIMKRDQRTHLAQAA
ncbi:hypothetical protein [Streptomyces incanus]|uniref:Transposase n=1 Tax=Streptomyces incanus TaxID=887453 RepID=A0ABW0XY34_9ACTN